MRVGRDNITTFNNYGLTPSDSNAGRIRAVTVSIEKTPIDENLWTVKVNNGTRGPITDLTVDVYVVDDYGNRTDDECVPAKDRISLPQLFEKLLGQALQGGLGAIGAQAQSFGGFGIGMQSHGLSSLGSYGPMMANQMTSSPQASAYLNQLQAGMLDSFPRVVTAGQHAGVAYFVGGDSQIQADIAFDDEEGNRWRRPYGQPPSRAE